MSSPTAAMVLVVEDEVDQREAVSELLRRRGYQVETACNGREALELMARSAVPPSLVLLDLNMPVLDGRGFLKQLADHATLRSVPVIVTSAAGLPSDIKAPAAIAFLAKPLQPQSMLELVAATLRHTAGVETGPRPVASGVVVHTDDRDTGRHRRAS